MACVSLKDGNLDTYSEHVANFHRSVVIAAPNEVLLRVWNTLAFELRIRSVVGKLAKELHDIVDSLSPSWTLSTAAAQKRRDSSYAISF
jgi:DNA-binding GntR family transcriptional regulator